MWPNRKPGRVREVTVLVELPAGLTALLCKLETVVPGPNEIAVLKLPPGEHRLLVRVQAAPAHMAGTLSLGFVEWPEGLSS